MAKRAKTSGGQTSDAEQRFDDTPEGWAKRWAMEFAASKKMLEKWHTRGAKIVQRYVDDRHGSNKEEKRLNLFTSNTQTMGALLYGNTPKVDVVRRFDDADDKVARVAGNMLERLLNTDIECGQDYYASALDNALQDRLLAGLGNARLRYSADFTQTEGTPATDLAPEVPPEDEKSGETLEIVYVPWDEQRWSAGGRVFDDVRWWAFLNKLSREELVDKFGDEGKLVSLNSKRQGSSQDRESAKADPWQRADVWEVWDKEHKCVWFWIDGHQRVLVPDGVEANENGSVPDPFQLRDFWPFPRPMFANLTTRDLVPTPDFTLAQDLYDQIDELNTRISLLIDAIKVAGLYDKTQSGIGRLLQEGTQNTLIPVDNWAMFAEKGGIKGVVDWLPIDIITAALDKLREVRTESMGLLFQVTGMSDIMRGQASTQTTATEQAIKARFASVRVQSLQDIFARFASEIQAKKAELICKLFDEQTIIERSNVMFTPDAKDQMNPQLVQQAVAFLKENHWQYRVEVKPESVSMTDYAALGRERSEALASIAQYFSAVQPLAQAAPGMQPFLLEILRWRVAGQRGSSALEAVIDQAIDAAEQQIKQQQMNPQPPPPDPKLIAAQMKAKTDMAKGQMDLQKTALEHRADMQRIQAETQGAVAEHAAKSQGVIAETEAKLRADAFKAVSTILPQPQTGGGGQ